MSDRLRLPNARRARPRRTLPTRLRRASLLGLVAAALVSTACRSAPRAAVATPWGEARAATRADAERVAALLEDLAPRVRALLPDTVDRPTDVWLEPFDEAAEASGRPEVVGLTTLATGRIRVRRDRLGRDADFVLAHELVHALLGPSWDPLPALLKEGLCDVVAARLAPEPAVRVHAVRFVDAAFSDPGMALELSYSGPSGGVRTQVVIPISGAERLDPVPALALAGGGLAAHEDPGDESALYGYGLLVADRIVRHLGLDGLHALCLRAAEAGHEVVPTPWLLAAAGLDEEPASWRRALVQGLATPELQAQCEFLAAELSGFLLRTFRYRFAGLTAEAFLDRSLPTVGWRGGETRVAVAMVDGVRSGLERHWDLTGPRPLAPGDAWSLRDGAAQHLTSLLPPTAEEPWLTLSRLALASTGAPRSGRAAPLAGTAGARVDTYIKVGRDDDGVWIESLHPQGLEHFVVELDGVVVADLEAGRNVVVGGDPRGWFRVTARLPGDLDLDRARLFAPSANLRVVQRVSGARDDDHYPWAIPRVR